MANLRAADCDRRARFDRLNGKGVDPCGAGLPACVRRRANIPAMACPHFYPVAHLTWPNAPKLPLGDPYTGPCQATACAIDPGLAAQMELCNLGYARDRCPHFPNDDGPDAVRFAVTADTGATIRIYWVREKDHKPFDHGLLEYSVADDSFMPGNADIRLRQQARAYVESYLRRKMRKQTAA